MALESEPEIQPTPLWLELRRSGRTSPSDLHQYFRIRVPPVPAPEIARDLGIGLWVEPNVAWECYLRANGESATLWLREGLHPIWVRWWCAHMLAHVLLHELPRDHAGGGPGSRDGTTLEACGEANRWAAGFLVPDFLLRPLVLQRQASGRMGWMFQVPDGVLNDRLKAYYPRRFR